MNMKTIHGANIFRTTFFALCIFCFATENFAADLKVNFQYMLSNFSGTVPSQWARLDLDQQHKEVYIFNQREKQVQIFNEQGMEIFSFDLEGGTAAAVDIAVGNNGNIYLLTRRLGSANIQVLTYRGEPDGTIAIRQIPEHIKAFTADRLVYKNGAFYLVNSGLLQIMVVDAAGEFQQMHDVGAQLLEMAGKMDPEKVKTYTLEMGGFSVDDRGTMYFTVPALFTAFLLHSDGVLESFGSSGSGVGKFGVVAGVVCDGKGNIYVTDRLRSVVMVFNRNYDFLGEFGYRGAGLQDNLVVPDDLAVDGSEGKIYVAQAANRGVSVFKIVFE